MFSREDHGITGDEQRLFDNDLSKSIIQLPSTNCPLYKTRTVSRLEGQVETQGHPLQDTVYRFTCLLKNHIFSLSLSLISFAAKYKQLQEGELELQKEWVGIKTKLNPLIILMPQVFSS